MSLDYKSTVYSYRRDRPFSVRSTSKTSYGHMTNWNHDEDMVRSNATMNRQRPFLEGYVMAGADPAQWQPVKASQIIEVLQAGGSRLRFVYNDLMPSSEILKKKNDDGSTGAQHNSMANVLCSPDMRLRRKRLPWLSNQNDNIASKMFEPMPPMPEKEISRKETTAMERDNWKLIR